MRAEVMPKPELPGHAILRVHDLNAAPDGLAICIERRQGPEKYLSDRGWQRSESWLAPEEIRPVAGGIDFHVGPVVCDMVAGLTVRLSIREPGVGNIGATVVAWPSMQTSGAYDPNRLVEGDAAAGTGGRGFGTGSAPTTVVRLPEAMAPPQPEPAAPPPPPFFSTDPAPPHPPPGEPAPLFPPNEPPPPFEFGPQGPPPPFKPTPPGPAAGPGLGAPDPYLDRIGGSEPRKKSSAGVWIALTAIVVLFLGGAGAGAYWWLAPCEWCRVAGKTPGTDGPTPPEPERLVADKFLKTSPAPEAMVERCRAFRQDNKQIAAFLICRAAAESGDPVGAAEYAAFFDPVNRAPGSPIDPDVRQAVVWYEKAAKVELPLAMRRLGQLYAKGANDLPADKAKACEWLSKAADKGDAEAKKTLDDLQCK